MQNGHSTEDLLSFLAHAGERGLLPAATAQAFAVAVRNVFSVLDDSERSDLPLDNLDEVIKRFNNKRARDFRPGSLKEYARRVKRSVDLYLKWKNDPANFSVKTRVTSRGRKRTDGPDATNAAVGPAEAEFSPESDDLLEMPVNMELPWAGVTKTYRTAVPIRPGHVVVIENIPLDLTEAEAEKMGEFVRMLGVVSGE